MLITPPETVAHNRGPMDCYVCPPEVLFSCIPPHVICTWSCLPLNKGNNKITEHPNNLTKGKSKLIII